MRNTIKQIVFGGMMLMLFAACKKDDNLVGDYQVPEELPAELVTGTPLGDSILALYNDLGVIVYTDVDAKRFTKDLVSEFNLTLRSAKVAADTAAIMLMIKMIREELYPDMPENNKNLLPRNFYPLKTPLITGSVSVQYYYNSYLWANSMSDITIGEMNAQTITPLFIKKAFYYAMTSSLRSIPTLSNYYSSFIQAKTDAAVYYWQVTSLTGAYERGYVTSDQRAISGNDTDFATFGAWAATVNPAERDQLLATYPLLARKYAFISSMYRDAGMPIEDINAAWQTSPNNK